MNQPQATTQSASREPSPRRGGKRLVRNPRPKSRTPLLAQGQPLVWLNGGALAVCLCMIVGLLILVFWQGMATFWPVPQVEVRTVGGKTYLGEVIRQESFRPEPSVFDALPEGARNKARALVEQNQGWSKRRLFRTANFDLTQTHHHWVSDFEIEDESLPPWALVIERFTNDGRFNGFPKAFLQDGKVVATEPAEVWAKYNEHHQETRKRVLQSEKIKKNDIGAVSRKEEDARLAVREAELGHGKDSSDYGAATQKLQEVEQWAAEQHSRLNGEISELKR